LEGLGLQEEGSGYNHPYFGTIFLSTIFRLIGYPDFLHNSTDLGSVDVLFSIPRILMGVIAVVDTFLVYKISEYRYNRNVAFIASVLFAVMPITWLLRQVYLDSILLPFLLTSILFSVLINSNKFSDTNIDSKRRRTTSIVLLSGTFLGLAIFTKIPVFTMIPLIGFLVYANSNKSLKMLGLWFIPVIMIPLIWPLYAAHMGNIEQWFDSVIWQATGRNAPSGFHTLPGELLLFFKLDPVFLVLGITSVGFVSIIKRDLLPVLWATPILLFFYFTHWVSVFHFIPIFPSFCIAAGILIQDISKNIHKRNFMSSARFKFNYKSVLDKIPYISFAVIAVFGLVSISMLIVTDVASFQPKAAAFALRTVMENDTYDSKNPASVTAVMSPIYLWSFRHVFNIEQSYDYNFDTKNRPFDSTTESRTNKVIMIVDEDFNKYIKNIKTEIDRSSADATSNITDNNPQTRWTRKTTGSWLESDLGEQKAICNIQIAWYRGNERSYNFEISSSLDGTKFRTILSGNSSGTTLLPENYNLENTVARYLKITVNGNTVNSYASITEIATFGHLPKTLNQDLCQNLTIKNIKTDNSQSVLVTNLPDSKKLLFILYNNTKSVATFNGTTYNYDVEQYPYTSLGWTSGGTTVDIRVNSKFK
jgi:hypothetical protein